MAMARQDDLPGMADRKLPDVHEAALVYEDAKQARIAASAPEVRAKQELMDLMKKHKLQHYQCDNLEVVITHEKESVRVRVHAQDAIEAAVDGNSKPVAKKKSKAKKGAVKRHGATELASDIHR